MAAYVVRRLLYMVVTMLAISVLVFAVIQLPPGDFITTIINALEARGVALGPDDVRRLEAHYGLDRPVYEQYFVWIRNIVLYGDFGVSFEWGRPVSELIWSRLSFTILLSLAAMAFTWSVAFAIGVYTAVRQYSVGDYFFTFLGFLGLAIPNFVLALVLMYVSFRYFGQSVGGLFSPEYVSAPWSWGRVMDLLAHIWIPIVIIGTAGTASLIRIMRANLLDELRRPYTVTARAKGVPERKALLKYPVRLALNPFVSTVGWMLPATISGETIISVVLSLPTTGPLLLRAMQVQDMYLAGSFLLILGLLTVVGTALSDLLLAWLDPRIRYEK